MKKRKLNLSELKVESFVTFIQPSESKGVKAGYESLNYNCPDWSTQLNVCCEHPIGYTTIPASQIGGEACPATEGTECPPMFSDYFSECDCTDDINIVHP